MALRCRGLLRRGAVQGGAKRQREPERSGGSQRPLTAPVVVTAGSESDHTDEGGGVLLALLPWSLLCLDRSAGASRPEPLPRSRATGGACRGLPPAPSDPPDLIPHRSVARAPERPHSPRGPSVAGTRSPGTRHAPHWASSVPNSGGSPPCQRVCRGVGWVFSSAASPTCHQPGSTLSPRSAALAPGSIRGMGL